MTNENAPIASAEYLDLKDKITSRIRSARYEASKAVNRARLALYWEIGKRITERQAAPDEGKSVVENLSRDIQREFPGIKGFGASDMRDMACFYAECRSNEILRLTVGEIGWSKHIVILTRCKEMRERQFYILATKRCGWTKDVLIHKIEAKTYEHYLLGQGDFVTAMPGKMKHPAMPALNEEYLSGLVGLADEPSEPIIKHIRAFLTALGPDFSFVGNRYRIEVDGREHFIDLLLYDRRLQAMIAIELETGGFRPEYKGKMELCLNVLNDTVRLPHENPAVGIVICQSEGRVIAEYALPGPPLPAGEAAYSLSSELPEAYKGLLPTSEEMAGKIALLMG